MEKKILLGTTIIVLCGFAGVAFAQSINLQNPLGTNCNNLSCPVTAVINFLFTLAIPICGIMVLVGGFQMMTAAGKPEAVSKGKKTILWAVIGFVVVLLSGSVALLIQNIFS